MTQLLSRNSFDVPPSLMRDQEYRMLLEAGVLRPGDDPAARKATLPEGLREEVATRARRQVRAVLLLDALARQLELFVPEEEVRQRVAEFAAASGVERQQQIEAFYAKEENQRALERRLLHEKTLRFVVDKATIKIVEQSEAEEGVRGVAGEEEKD